MDKTQKIIVTLLIVAILFSAASVILNVSLVMSLDPSELGRGGTIQDSGVSSGEVSLYVSGGSG